MTVSTYQDAHPLYRHRGWPSALPLPRGVKWPPPSGFTGWDGIYPSFADCLDFDELPTYRGTTQTMLRMPSTVTGIDIDGYSGKTGPATIAEAERRWGPLPDGAWSSARDDGVSGIRFYRIPDGAVLVSNIAFPELRVGHVEVIQRHHRYAVVWPSVHPDTGTRYTWRGTSGPDRPATVDELPELPATWLQGLAGTGRQGERVQPAEVAAFLADLPGGEACPAVQAALQAAGDGLWHPVVSRHDDTCAAVLRLLRLGEQGHPGVAAALVALRAAFGRAVVADGSRTPAAARAEFNRMREGENGIGLIRSTPTPPERRGCRCAAPATRMPAAAVAGIVRAVLRATGDERERLLRWAARKLRGQVAAGHLTEDTARELLRQMRQHRGTEQDGRACA